jgi:hypothetical protein
VRSDYGEAESSDPCFDAPPEDTCESLDDVDELIGEAVVDAIV